MEIFRARNRPISLSIFLISSVIIWFGCDKGIAPQEATSSGQSNPSGFKGTIYYKNWPPDSLLVDLRVVAFNDYPPADIISELTQGRAQYTEMLKPYRVDSLEYTLILSAIHSAVFRYIVVAQQYGPNIQTDWRTVGVYYANGDTTSPGIIAIISGTILTGININVDFLHPPITP